MAEQSSGRKAEQPRPAREVILGDGAATLTFMVINSVWDELAAMLAVTTGLALRTAGLIVLITGLMLYVPFSAALFGADTSFNPLNNNAAFAAAGKGASALHVARMAAQALGGAVGTAVALRWVPRGWQGRFRTFDRGLKPGVSLAAGAACEGALSFLINLVVLWSLATRWVQFNGHSAAQHVVIYWAAPLAGAVAAGALWNALTAPPRRGKPRAPKPRDARSSRQAPKRAAAAKLQKKDE